MDDDRCPIPYCAWKMRLTDDAVMLYPGSVECPPPMGTPPLTAECSGVSDFSFRQMRMDEGMTLHSEIVGIALAAHLRQVHPRDRRIPAGSYLWP